VVQKGKSARDEAAMRSDHLCENVELQVMTASASCRLEAMAILTSISCSQAVCSAGGLSASVSANRRKKQIDPLLLPEQRGGIEVALRSFSRQVPQVKFCPVCHRESGD